MHALRWVINGEKKKKKKRQRPSPLAQFWFTGQRFVCFLLSLLLFEFYFVFFFFPPVQQIQRATGISRINGRVRSLSSYIALLIAKPSASSGSGAEQAEAKREMRRGSMTALSKEIGFIRGRARRGCEAGFGNNLKDTVRTMLVFDNCKLWCFQVRRRRVVSGSARDEVQTGSTLREDEDEVD